MIQISYSVFMPTYSVYVPKIVKIGWL